MQNLVGTQNNIEMVGSGIVEELLRWRLMQQKSLSGAPEPGPLDEIQEWYVDILYALGWSFKPLTLQLSEYHYF